jgi:hypothetical protein
MKALFLTILTLISITTYTQTVNQISIKTIRSKIDNLGSTLKSDAQVDNMYLFIGDEGKRWIYINMNQVDGLKSDEQHLSRQISEQIVQMIYKAVNYDLEQTINLKTFANTLDEKSIKGVRFETMNNIFLFNWSEVLNIELVETAYKDEGCYDMKIPPAPVFREAGISFPMEYLKDDFSCNDELYYVGYILKVSDNSICLKDGQGLVREISFDKSILDNASRSWIPHIMVLGNKVYINAVTCGNGGHLQIKSIKNLKR